MKGSNLRTRSSSLTEKYLIYSGIVLAVVLSLSGAFVIYRSYSSGIEEIKHSREELQVKEEELNREKESIMARISALQNQLSEKEKKISSEKAEFEKKFKELEEHIAFIPPYYMKSGLRKAILERATLLNLDVLNYSAQEIDPGSFTGLKFFPLEFNMEMNGEYSAVKKFLWFLDNLITIEDISEKGKKWNFIVKIADGGLEFSDPHQSEYAATAAPSSPEELTKARDPRAVQNTQQAVPASPSDLLSTLPLEAFIKNRDGLLNNEKLSVKMRMTTYFRREK